jgi:hypothetical protein
MPLTAIGLGNETSLRTLFASTQKYDRTSVARILKNAGGNSCAARHADLIVVIPIAIHLVMMMVVMMRLGWDVHAFPPGPRRVAAKQCQGQQADCDRFRHGSSQKWTGRLPVF